MGTWHVNNKITSPEVRGVSTTLETTKITSFYHYNYLLFYDITPLVAEHDTGKPQFRHPPGSNPIGGGDIGDWYMYLVHGKLSAGDYTPDQIYNITIRGEQGTRTYKVLWLSGRSINTPLRTLDYLISILYEKYQWVQWRIYPGPARRFLRH